MKVVEETEGRGWKILHLETQHLDIYIEETLLVQILPDGKVASVWGKTASVHLLKPEVAARAIQAQTKAIAEGQGKIRRAQEAPQCVVCLGSGKDPNDPEQPCRACSPRGG